MAPEHAYPVPRPPLPVVVSPLRPVEAKSHVAFTVFKWYPLILAFGAALMITAAVAMLMRPVMPSATAKILIKAGSDDVPITGLPVSGTRTTQEFLQTEAELFMSRTVLLPVARMLRNERGEVVSDAELDPDVAALRAGLAVSLVPGTTMLQARKDAPTEAEAERLLRMTIDSYVEQHATAYSGARSLSTFFEQETATASGRLKEAEDRLQQWRETNDVVSAEEQILAQLATVGEFQVGLRRAEMDIDGARARIAALTRDIAALPREAVTSREQMANPLIARLKSDIATEEAALRDLNRSPVTERLRIELANAELAARDVAASPLVAKLKGDLVTAELQLNDLLQRYTDGDRRVQEKLEQIERLRQGVVAAERDTATAADERIQNLRRELAGAQADVERTTRARIEALKGQLAAAERERDVFGRETLAPNPLRELLNRDLVAERGRLTTLLAQRDGLRGQLDDARSTLATLRTKRVEAERMNRDVELAKAVYLQTTRRLDDARLTVGLRKQQLTNIAVTEPPRATPGHRSLKQVALVAVLGALVGLALGMAAAMALDFFNWSLRTPDDVEFYLGVPAVAAIPAVTGAARRPYPLPRMEERDMSPHARDDRSRD